MLAALWPSWHLYWLADHQYEEYVFPGCGPAMANMLSKDGVPNRHPLDQNSAMIGNALIVYGMYPVPVFFQKLLGHSYENSYELQSAIRF